MLCGAGVAGWREGGEGSSSVKKLSVLGTQLDYVTVLKHGNIRRDVNI